MKARTVDQSIDVQDAIDSPMVWVLEGHRAGDNLQLQTLAEGIGWRWTVKKLDWQKQLPIWTPYYSRSISLKHLTPASRSELTPPWPDLVLSIGWRSVPVARWIQKQCTARLVHLGRPRASLSYFNLVLTTPQYGLPTANNVLCLTGPLNTQSPTRLANNANAWQNRLLHLPRPWTAVFVGGSTPSLKFSKFSAQKLVNICNDHKLKVTGSLLVATSPRTPRFVTEVLRKSLDSPSFIYFWHTDTDNPYAAYLALADEFIVTNDSISMTQEAALTQRPVQIFSLTQKNKALRELILNVDKKIRNGNKTLSQIYLNCIRMGIIFPPKSPDTYFKELHKNGQINFLGMPLRYTKKVPLIAENDNAIRAVYKLFEQKRLN